MIVYHDVNDFFYSGHVGLTCILMSELRHCGDYRGYKLGVFVLIFEALMLVFSRTHYIIDMTCGFVMGKYSLILAQQIVERAGLAK